MAEQKNPNLMSKSQMQTMANTEVLEVINARSFD